MIQSFNPSKTIAIALRDINPKLTLQRISQMMGSTEKSRESALNMVAIGEVKYLKSVMYDFNHEAFAVSL
ncbi:hypothetical protein V2H45_15630 [Tumidithrix elongata RA019]|uniref:Uncharacterized protein n=1 Tax=Tumidithrix elongata BACA0141 TaxID=2716417 RepID=A0AAW9Q5F0_9CYAN|nr:hypothetical protein [Tumidithrix elongata RA019]